MILQSFSHTSLILQSSRDLLEMLILCVGKNLSHHMFPPNDGGNMLRRTDKVKSEK